MPSKSQAQHNLMEGVAHGWKPSGMKAPPVSVAKEFSAADAMQKHGVAKRSGEHKRHPSTDHFKMRMSHR